MCYILFWDSLASIIKVRPVRKSIFSQQQRHLQEFLREVRTEARLRQVDLAKRLGQPQSFVSKYESGERRLDLIELRQICKALNIPLIDFVKRFEVAIK